MALDTEVVNASIESIVANYNQGMMNKIEALESAIFVIDEHCRIYYEDMTANTSADACDYIIAKARVRLLKRIEKFKEKISLEALLK